MSYYKFILFLLLATAHPAIAQLSPPHNPAGGAPYWQQQVDYSIDVSLNDIEHTLDGFVRMQYANHSPDTLSFIWIHLWPNAYRNDRTAFSEQLLGNGRTSFYFSSRDQKGYINRLDFRVDDQPARMEDHPLYIDIIKVLLPKPLPPGGTISITTPFHEKLPYNFSRGGHVGHSYQATQWFPKPAVYDRKGWHPIPYLDQGEFYSEFGDFDVRITLPANYVVAASGELIASSVTPIAANPVAAKPAAKHPVTRPPVRRAPPHPLLHHKAAIPEPPQSTAIKTLRFRGANMHDFAWFADRGWHTDTGTLRLPSGRTITITSCYAPRSEPVWKNSIQFIKDAISFRTPLIGEYPYPTVTVVEAPIGTQGGMEYPSITSISPQHTARELDLLIEHEVGHNWFYAALATDERNAPWMDEGTNAYYDQRYQSWKYPAPANHAVRSNNAWLTKKIPDDLDSLFINTLAAKKRDQPIATRSGDFTSDNYNLIAYTKTAIWMRQLQDSIGPALFDSCMREYYRRWQFRHPYPEDFRAVVEEVSQHGWQAHFDALDRKGPISPITHRVIRPAFLFSGAGTDKIDYINILPAIGYNKTDAFMVGAIFHNYNLPPDPFRFFLIPLYGTGSHQFDGIGGVSYHWYPGAGALRHITAGFGAEKFSSLSAADSNGKKLYGGFYKLAPSFRFTFRNPSARSTREEWLQWKTYLIGERAPTGYVRKSTDSLAYPARIGKYEFRYLNELSYRIADRRVLYPYAALLQVQQADKFYRVNFTGNYFFNYSQEGGVDVRIFAAKFGYLGARSASDNLTRFQPKLTGIAGDEDYTYSNYFFGRNEFSGFSSQQIMMRDGALKMRVPNFPFLEGRSDNWVSSLNLSTTLPRSIVPSWLPLKAFFDIGTYSGGWQSDPPTSKFLYVGGLELSLVHDILHFYAPLLYSGDFRDQLKTLPDQNTFWKRLSFSVDIQNLDLHKVFKNIPL